MVNMNTALCVRDERAVYCEEALAEGVEGDEQEEGEGEGEEPQFYEITPYRCTAEKTAERSMELVVRRMQSARWHSCLTAMSVCCGKIR